MVSSFVKLAACCRHSAPPSIARSLGYFSTAALPASASKKLPTPGNNNYSRFLPPTTMVPPLPSPPPFPPNHRRINETSSIDAETTNLVMALQNLQKKEETGINKLQWMLDSLRIARILPTSTTVLPVQPQRSTQQQQQHRTFQIMNRNARKAKRANHGKRPCSRIRRRYKVKAWANTSRKG